MWNRSKVFRDLNTSKASSEKPLFFKLSITVKALIFMDYCGAADAGKLA